jgi:hypothetical protein
VTIRAKFTGPKNADGVAEEFLHGIPARDLDEDEDWAGLTTEQKDEVRKSGLYDVKTERDMRSKSTASHKSESKPAESPPTEEVGARIDESKDESEKGDD